MFQQTQEIGKKNKKETRKTRKKKLKNTTFSKGMYFLYVLPSSVYPVLKVVTRELCSVILYLFLQFVSLK
jgi:hypothetical protein